VISTLPSLSDFVPSRDQIRGAREAMALVLSAMPSLSCGFDIGANLK